MAATHQIVVTGARRSGTTLVAAVISSASGAPPFPGEAQLLTRWIEDYRWACEHFAVRGRPFFADQMELSRFLRKQMEGFFNHCDLRFGGAEVQVFKSPELALVVAEAIELLPGAKFVITVRDPRDQVASEWRVLERRRSQGDIRILADRDFDALARNYLRYYRALIAAIDRRDFRPEIIRFEDLVRNPAASINVLGRSLGLDLSGFDPGAAWPALDESYWAYGTSPSDTEHYGQPIAAGRAGAYREVMTAAEADRVLQLCADVTTRFGYGV